MRLRFLFAFPFLFTFTSSNFLESATIGNRTILVGFFSVKTTDLSSLKIGDKEWAQLKEMLLPVDFFQQIADNSPPCDAHDPNCKSCDPHDPNCKSSGNPGGHGGGEIEAWMKRMLYMLVTTLICGIIALLLLLVLLGLFIRGRKQGGNAKL